METNGKIIAACGLDCAVCKAYIATRTNDHALRASTAAEWTKQFGNGFTFTADMINCDGCFATSGVQIGHCAECAWRACVVEKGLANCAACADFNQCDKTRDFYKNCPEALANLQALKAGA